MKKVSIWRILGTFVFCAVILATLNDMTKLLPSWRVFAFGIMIAFAVLAPAGLTNGANGAKERA